MGCKCCTVGLVAADFYCGAVILEQHSHLRRHRFSYSAPLSMRSEYCTAAPGHFCDISLHGALFQSAQPPQIGEAIVLDFDIDGIPVRFSVPAIVRWRRCLHSSATNVGVQFVSLRPIEVWALSGFLRGLRSSSALQPSEVHLQAVS